MPTLQETEAEFLKAHNAGNKAEAQRLATEVKRMRREGSLQSQRALARPGAITKPTPSESRQAQEDADRERYAPDTSDLGANFRAGIGSTFTSALRAVGGGRLAGMMGLPAEREEAKRLDEPLDATTSGTLGKATGTAALASLAIPFTPASLPTAAGAGVLTRAGAAALPQAGAGGATGALLTEGDPLDRLQGGLEGALGGAVASGVPTAVRTGRGLVRGLVEPLTLAGRGRIAGRTLERFSSDPDALMNLQASQLLGRPSVTGAQPTLPELLRDPGLASLERAMASTDPQAAASVAARQEANNAARIDALGALTGESTRPASRVRRLNQIAQGQPTLATATARRAGSAANDYGDAYAAGIVPGSDEAMAPQIQELLRRPSVQDARMSAQRAAQESGLNEVPETTVQGLHFLKKALDEQKGVLNRAGNSGEAGRVGATAAGFDSVLEELSPMYQAARGAFQQNSVPVTRAEIGERLLNATRGAVRDFSGNRPLQANAYSKALNDEGKLISDATGFRGNPDAQLGGVLTATQMGRVSGVRDELETLANLDRLANGKGSQTAKMLASQNLMRQIAGPLGMPEGFSTGMVSQTLQRIPQIGFQMAEPNIQAQIARGLLDPAEGLRLILEARARDAVRPAGPGARLTRRAVPGLIGVSAADASSQ